MRRPPLRLLVLAGLLAGAVACDELQEAYESIPAIGGHGDGRLEARPGTPTEPPPPPGRHELEIGDRRVLLYVPRDARGDRPLPFALLLHGAGGSAEGGFRIWARDAERAGVILLAPESQHGGAWDVMVTGFGADAAAIDEQLTWVFDRFAVDRSHIAIGGFSNGATYALSLGLTNGDLFTHVVALSPGFMRPNEEGRPRVFVAHGLDDRVLPIDRTSRVIVPRLRDQGYRVRFVTFDAGHHLELNIARKALRWFLGRARA